MKEIFHLNQKELDCMNVFEDIKEKRLTQEKAAIKLKMSLRQLKRKFKRYKADGPAGLTHKGRGKRSNRTLEEAKEKEIMASGRL